MLIDYPDFNFRLMHRLRRIGIPVVYYISPQLWAWRASRIRLMKRGATRVLPIFPFEEAIYQRARIDVRFVGHPLIDLAKPRLSRDAFLKKLNLDPAKPVMALLPGSRTNELARLAPVIAEAVPKIAARVPGVQFVIARAPNLDDGLFEPFGLSGVTLRIADTQTDDVLNASDAVITASGTATVQAALHGKPMVVIYKLSPMTYRLGIRLALVDRYAMVNLIAGDRVVVELIQDACTGDAIADEAVRLLNDQDYRASHGRRDRATCEGQARRPWCKRPGEADAVPRCRTSFGGCAVAFFVILLVSLLVASADATTVVPLSFDKLVSESSAVVYGRVSDVRSQWTADRRFIESVVSIEVIKGMKGGTR